MQSYKHCSMFCLDVYEESNDYVGVVVSCRHFSFSREEEIVLFFVIVMISAVILLLFRLLRGIIRIESWNDLNWQFLSYLPGERSKKSLKQVWRVLYWIYKVIKIPIKKIQVNFDNSTTTKKGLIMTTIKN